VSPALVKMAQVFDWSMLWYDRDRINSPDQSKENRTSIPCRKWNGMICSTPLFSSNFLSLSFIAQTCLPSPEIQINSQIRWKREGLLVLAMSGTKGVPVHEPGRGVRGLAIEQKQPRSRPSPVNELKLLIPPQPRRVLRSHS
jgi:hypothetical protein